MEEENPYRPTAETGTVKAANPSLLYRSTGFVAICGLVGGVLGFGLGAMIGWLLPGYYRSVFSGGNEPNFDPVAVGMGQGLTQGIVLGGLLGIVLVALYYWHQTRATKTVR